jgi:hypothetical protein
MRAAAFSHHQAQTYGTRHAFEGDAVERQPAAQYTATPARLLE